MNLLHKLLTSNKNILLFNLMLDLILNFFLMFLKHFSLRDFAFPHLKTLLIILTLGSKLTFHLIVDNSLLTLIKRKFVPPLESNSDNILSSNYLNTFLNHIHFKNLTHFMNDVKKHLELLIFIVLLVTTSHVNISMIKNFITVPSSLIIF